MVYLLLLLGKGDSCSVNALPLSCLSVLSFFPFDSFTFCTMCFGHIQPLQLFPDYPLIPHPYNLCVSPTPQTSSYCPNIPGSVFSHWSVVTLPAATLSENTASPFPVSPAANNCYLLHSPLHAGFPSGLCLHRLWSCYCHPCEFICATAHPCEIICATALPYPDAPS